MDTREVYIEWDGEETYLGRIDEVCGESPYPPEAICRAAVLTASFRDIIASLAFATNEDFPDTVKIIIREN